MTNFLHPSTEQLAALGSIDPATPVVMLNLLRFADRAPADSVATGMTGQEAYAEYGRRVLELDGIFTGAAVPMGSHLANVIGPDHEQWDDIVVVRYDALSDFLAMATNAQYLEAAQWRTAALVDSRLVAFRDTAAET